MNLERRRAMLLAVSGTALLSGCTSIPPASSGGDYCFRAFKSKRHILTCMPAPVPSDEVEAEAKRFEPTPGKLTVYLVRKHRNDTRNVVRLSSDGAPNVDMVPESFARWRLPAGSQHLTVTWSGGSAGLDIVGAPGEVVFVEVIGRVGIVSSSYRLERGDAAESRRRVLELDLVADVG